MQKNIANTLFYSLLFAMGGAPTIAMLIIQVQSVQADLIYPIFIGLSVMVACVLVPLILLQNTFLLVKRHDERLNLKMEIWSSIYLWLNGFCLLYWIAYQFMRA